MLEQRRITIEDRELQTRSAKNEKGQNEIVGYAALVEKRSKPITEKISINGMPAKLETFIETLDKRAFEGAQMDDVLYTIDHDPSKLVARKSAGNLTLTVTEKGLMFRATPPETTLAKDLQLNIEAGNYQENSFAFRVKSEEWSRVEGVLYRHITGIERIADVSTVVEGAYADTAIASRSITLANEPVLEVNEVEKDSIDFDFLQYKYKKIA